MIARALTSHKDGSPNWVMRRRSQRETDQLVEAAGFEKIRQWIDDDGIFTISLAMKNKPHRAAFHPFRRPPSIPSKCSNRAIQRPSENVQSAAFMRQRFQQNKIL